MNMSYISMQTDGYVQKNHDPPLEGFCILETDSLEMFDTTYYCLDLSMKS